MAFYTVHLPPEATTPDEVAEKAVFVKEGFAFFGFAFGGLWLLFHRMWLLALAYGCAFGLVLLIFQFFQLPIQAYGLITMLMAGLIGLEGHEWLRRSYARKGWMQAGTVSGPSLAECERRFFRGWLDEQATAHAAQTQPAKTMQAASTLQNTSLQAANNPVLGIFPAARDRS